MRTDCIAQGTLVNTLCWPKWEGNPRKGGWMYPCGWFTLLQWIQQKLTHRKVTIQHSKLKIRTVSGTSKSSPSRNRSHYSTEECHLYCAGKMVAMAARSIGWRWQREGPSAVSERCLSPLWLLKFISHSPGDYSQFFFFFACLSQNLGRWSVEGRMNQKPWEE